jgi:hypothetical protein
MMALIPGISKIYGMLLRLFPRDFQNEFKEEMEDVFAASLEEAAKTGATLVVRACFFELFDLPVNLLVEHLSSLRKGNIMKTLSYEVGRSRAVLMAALGMMVGWVLINLVGEYLFTLGLLELPFTLVGTILFSLPVILCGLMLGIAAGVGRRAFLRIGLWSAAGGLLGHLVTLPVRMANSAILRRFAASSRDYNISFMIGLVVVMCIYGLFFGAGLGFAFGSWKASLKFALVGLVANAVGILTGYFIASSVRGIPDPSYITWSIMGALAGGILGWFVGNKKQPAVGATAVRLLRGR